MSFILLGILNSQVSPGGGAPAYDLLQSTILTSSASSVTFSSIPSDYKHLQIRYTAKNTGGAFQLNVVVNNDTTTQRSSHDLRGQGSAVQSSASTFITNFPLYFGITTSTGGDSFAAGVVDILDYANTNKNTTMKSFHGQTYPNTMVYLSSGLYPQTGAITDIKFQPSGNSLAVGSRFSLYGIKG